MSAKEKSHPICVVIGDIHFTPHTLDLATHSLKKAIGTAKELNVPLILNGDTIDTKAIIRAEVANRLIEIFTCDRDLPRIIINIGNHDKISNKSDDHALVFLAPYADVIKVPIYDAQIDSWIIPYQDEASVMQSILENIPAGSRLIVHSGVMTANMGAYIQDKSSLPPAAFEDYRVIASHYHQAQDIKCGRPRKGAVGLFSYVGSPFTHTFAEANDGPKGIQILHDNGLLEFVSLNLRRHIIKEVSIEELPSAGEGVRSEDLLWIKVHGHKSELDKLKKQDIAKMVGRDSFKLDLIPLDNAIDEEIQVKYKDDPAVLDGLIDKLNEPPEWQSYLKFLWREIVG